MTTGAESAEKMLRPVPAYSIDSLDASFARCSEGSSPEAGTLRASAPAELLDDFAEAPVCMDCRAEAGCGAGRGVAAIGAGVGGPPINWLMAKYANTQNRTAAMATLRLFSVP